MSEETTAENVHHVKMDAGAIIYACGIDGADSPHPDGVPSIANWDEVTCPNCLKVKPAEPEKSIHVKRLEKARIDIPENYALWDAVVAMGATNTKYGLAAALGASWKGPGALRIMWDGAHPDRFAEQVINALVERGGPGFMQLALYTKGVDALNAMSERIISAVEVHGAVGNSPAPTGASTA